MSRPVKRSAVIDGHSTSLSLEPEFWAELERLAEARSLPLARLIGRIDRERGERNLSSAARVHVLEALQTLPSPQARGRGK
jgi:predicted DNA-binding ribbon-helix-helix protein